ARHASPPLLTLFPYTTLFRSRILDFFLSEVVPNAEKSVRRAKFKVANKGTIENAEISFAVDGQTAFKNNHDFHADALVPGNLIEIGRAHVCTPVTRSARMPSS